MHAHCTPPPENSGKGRGNLGKGSTRMCFLRLTNMPNAMIMDLRKRFFRMTDALFFHRLLHRRNKSSTDFSQQPTERMVTDAILKSELHAFQRMVEISRERSQWVFTAQSMSQRKNCGIMAVFAIPPELIWHWSLRGRQKGWRRFRGLGPAQRS